MNIRDYESEIFMYAIGCGSVGLVLSLVSVLLGLVF